MSPMRFLNESEEAVGTLLAVNVHKNWLLISLDSAEFNVDFHSTRSLQSTRERLFSYIGRKVGIFRDSDVSKPLRIRLATPNNELMVGDYQQ